MKRLLLTTFAVLALNACIPGAKPGIDNRSPSVIIVGSFVATGPTKVYFGKETRTIAEFPGSTSFRIEISRDQLAQAEDRRLYFYSESKEAGVTPEISSLAIGEKQLEPLVLGPEIPLTGTILEGKREGDEERPVSEVMVSLGRRETVSDAAGRYIIMAPRAGTLPLLLRKQGFVHTRALWQLSGTAEIRDFHLYNRLEPTGTVSVPATNRSVGGRVALYVERTPNAAFVRLSSSPIDTPPELDGSWLDLNEALEVSAEMLAKPKIYYQFADESKTVLGKIKEVAPATVSNRLPPVPAATASPATQSSPRAP